MNEEEHGGNVRKWAKFYSIPVEKVIDFSANIVPTKDSKKIITPILNNLKSIHTYPDPTYQELREVISSYVGVSSSNILVGNGGVDLIYLIVYTFKPKKTLIIVPTFSEYERAVKAVNSEIEFVYLREEEGFKLDLEKLTHRIKNNNVDLMFLCNPNNPTGRMEKKEEVEKLIFIALTHNTKIVIDEVFIDFLPTHKFLSFANLATQVKNLVIIRSLTKVLGIPGLRIGYLITEVNNINLIKKHSPPWSVNSLAEMVVKPLLTQKNYFDWLHKWVSREREYLFTSLSTLPTLQVFPSEVNFFLIKLLSSDCVSLQTHLAKFNILIRNCSNFRGLSSKFFRISCKKREENKILVKGIKSFFSNG